jgi:predicted MFS family arabinose efflux permease
VGTFITPLHDHHAGLIFAIGVLAAGGAGMAGPAVLMAASTRMMPPEKRGLATGIVNAGGSFGQFAMAPIAGLIVRRRLGQRHAGLGALVLLAVPAAWVLRAIRAGGAGRCGLRHQASGARQAVSQAIATPSYLLLAAGFFVCGFPRGVSGHPPARRGGGLRPAAAMGGWALAMLGLFNIVGSLAIGWAVGRWRMKSLLALLYATRGLAVLVFLLAPKTRPWCWCSPPSWA